MALPFQKRYPDRYSHCYGCGHLRADGLHVESFWSDDQPDVAVCHYVPDAKFTGGWPDVMYGGLIASLIDCHSGATASATKARELGLGADAELPRFVTAALNVNFHAPTPAGAALELRAQVTQLEGRKAWVQTEVIDSGKITVSARVLMIMVDDN